MSKKIIRLTESQLTMLIMKINESFEDEWPDLKDEVSQHFPEWEWIEKKLKEVDKNAPWEEQEKQIRQIHKTPEMMKYFDAQKKANDYYQKRAQAYAELKLTPELNKILDILGIPDRDKEQYKTKQRIVNYIADKEKKLSKAKKLLGI